MSSSGLGYWQFEFPAHHTLRVPLYRPVWNPAECCFYLERHFHSNGFERLQVPFDDRAAADAVCEPLNRDLKALAAATVGRFLHGWTDASV